MINPHITCNFAFVGEVAIHALALHECHRRKINLDAELRAVNEARHPQRAHQIREKLDELKHTVDEIWTDIGAIHEQDQPDDRTTDLAHRILARVCGYDLDDMLKKYRERRTMPEKSDDCKLIEEEKDNES